MNRTKIPYAEFTFNLWTGCYGPDGNGPCSYCYARGIARHFAKKDGWQFIHTTDQTPWGPIHIAKVDSPPFPMGFEPTLHIKRLSEPERRRKPATIFVGDMTDIAGDWIPDDWLALLFQEMRRADWHRYLLLTKNPKRLADYATEHFLDGLPAHVWVGTTVEDQAAADKRLPELLRIRAALWVSYEPALGPLQLRDGWQGKVGWLVCGGQSGPGAKPMHPDWARSVRDQCKAAGMPWFFKQWGEWLPDSQVPYYRDDPAVYPRFAKAPFGALARDGWWKPGWYSQLYEQDHPGAECLYHVRTHTALLDGQRYEEMPR